MSAHHALAALIEHIEKDIPGFRVAYKDEPLDGPGDWKLKVAAKVVGLFNKKFMTGYTTTLYPVVYFRSRQDVEEDPLGAFRTLAHEYVHLWDEKKRRVWFPTSYLMPQLFAPLSLLAFGAFWSLWFLLFLLFLLCLAPIRSPWRTRAELRGYSMNLFTRYWHHDKVPENLKEYIVPKFTDVGTYYRMWPNAKAVRAELDRRGDLIEAERFIDEMADTEPYRVCRQIWMDNFPK
jgi:hypothetical protein